MPKLRHIFITLCAAIFGFSGTSAQEPETVIVADTLDINLITLPNDSIVSLELCADSLVSDDGSRMRVFNPDPTRATWLSVLCPGLGQIYNRKYWKLPIVVGAYMGLIYATDWNNTMLTDYTKAYNDLMDSDPDTKSYMNFFAPGVSESSLSQDWLQRTFQSRKNYFRRNRDLCIVGMIGVYLVAILDAYVDASLAHFDISPDLTLQWSPTIFQQNHNPLPSFGVQWALSF